MRDDSSKIVAAARIRLHRVPPAAMRSRHPHGCGLRRRRPGVKELARYLFENLYFDFQGDISLEKVRELLREEDSKEARALLAKIIEEQGVDDVLITMADCLREHIRTGISEKVDPRSVVDLRRKLRAFAGLVLLALVAGCDQGSRSPNARKDQRSGSSLPTRRMGPVSNARWMHRQSAVCRSTRPSSCASIACSCRRRRLGTSLLLYTGNPNNQPGAGSGDVLQPTYDVVERVVSFRLPEGKGLAPSTLYTVELPAPVEDGDFGFRAFDGAPLTANRLPLKFSFFTSSVEEPVAPAEPIPDCSEVLTIFSANPGQGACSNCHNPERAPQGLDLSSGNTLLATAIGRVAHQTDLGTTTGAVLENPVRMGSTCRSSIPADPTTATSSTS